MCILTAKGYSLHTDGGISKDDTTPIMVVVPGLTSDSASAVSFSLTSII